MNLIFYHPPKHLQKFVRYFWSCDFTSYEPGRSVFFDNYADKYPRLVFQADDYYQLKLNRIKQVPKAYVCGIDTFPSSMSVEANFSHFGISFQSFALTEVFKLADQLLVNEIVDLADLGFSSLVAKLASATSHSNRVEIVCRFIEEQTNHIKVVHDDVIQIVLNNELGAQADLFKLQKKYKTTERTLERLFKSAMGISPKTFQRLARFETALSLLKNPVHTNSASVGYLLNYTDQSHFIKDFKKFTNNTPSQFQKNNFLLSESSAFISKV